MSQVTDITSNPAEQLALDLRDQTTKPDPSRVLDLREADGHAGDFFEAVPGYVPDPMLAPGSQYAEHLVNHDIEEGDDRVLLAVGVTVAAVGFGLIAWAVIHQIMSLPA